MTGFSVTTSGALATLLTLLATCAFAGGDTGEKVDFNRDVQPILSDKCFHCHGPDAATRKGNLRLDTEKGAFALIENRAAFVAGHPEKSEVVRRITTKDPDLLMPPPDSNRTLSPEQTRVIQQWIEQGAIWAKHWSLVPPARPVLPKFAHSNWARNPIDQFILARLESEKLEPSPTAEKEKLIRRVTFDLTGLPPKLEEIDAFLADNSADAYEKLVDRLLASPRYGERMVVEWLDASRYADSNGYQGDPTRTSWPWRDWCIDVMNDNMPYDQFVIEQLAGDLLPNPTPSQRLATSFNRNHPFNAEGGRIPEETRVENVVDRVDTTGTAFLGLTVACSRCHDHKYDPISQKEYYQLYAFFNQSSETGRFDGGRVGNVAPTMRVTKPEQEARLAELTATLARNEAALKDATAKADAEQSEWEKTLSADVTPDWTVPDVQSTSTKSGAPLTRLDDGSLLAGGSPATTDLYELQLRSNLSEITGLRLELISDPSLPKGGPGRAENGNFVLSEIEGEFVSPADEVRPIVFRKGTAEADFSQKGFVVASAVDGDVNTGWAVMGTPQRSLSARFALDRRMTVDSGTIIKLRFRQDYASDNGNAPPGQHLLGRFRVAFTSEPILPKEVGLALAVKTESRNPAQKKAIRDFYQTVAPTLKPLDNAVVASRKALNDFEKSLTKVMVMDDASPRQSHILVRGAYDKPGEKVSADIFSVLNPFPEEAPRNRLGLAKWLVDSANPLLARVTVNRYWQSFFGVGLVKTADDFGLQGEKPSHPELLDWLAVEFRESGWNVKALHRLIVTSNTYRQSSKVTPALVGRDPENRLMARGPRYRHSSFMIRDAALAASGLMVEKLGGAPVNPYQPPGLWEDMSLGKIKYVQDHGEALYRRSVYTFWRRTVAPATMFDVPQRTVCSVRQIRTNTPLHALALLNDTTYVEAARFLAERLLKDGSLDDAGRIKRAFRILTSRNPTDAEYNILAQAIARLRRQYQSDTNEAKRLLAVGEKPFDAKLDATDAASLATLISTIMNMDETITQE